MKIIKLFWLLIYTIALLELVGPLEYTYEMFHLIMNIIVFVGFLVLLVVLKKNLHWFYKLAMGIFSFVLFFQTTIDLLSFSSGYKTQYIIYRSVNNPNDRIEYVWSDQGALGYGKAYQKVTRITSLFEWRINVDLDKIDKTQWNEVNEYVNELGLKGD